MRLLSFDTSTSDLHLCLFEQGQIAASRVIANDRAERQYTATLLMPSIDILFKEAGWNKADLKALVVGTGPGSFTGIRTAVVTARTIAQALQLPLVGIPLFECYAYRHGVPVAVVLNAGAERFFAAAYKACLRNANTTLQEPVGKPSDLTVMVAPAYANKEVIFEMLKNIDCWIVDASSLAALNGTDAKLVPLPTLNNIAEVQSELAFNRLSLIMTEASAKLDSQPNEDSLIKAFPYELVEPLYLRNASVSIKGPS